MTAAIIALFFIGLFISGMLIYSTMSWGWVCFKFWAWFVLPIFAQAFPQMPEITFLQACGLMFFIGLFRNQYSISIKKEYRDDQGTLTAGFIAPWLTLLIGWLFMVIFM